MIIITLAGLFLSSLNNLFLVLHQLHPGYPLPRGISLDIISVNSDKR